MKISVVMACRNAAGTVGAALESAARQRRDGFALELVVVDGASTDGTAEAVRRFAESVKARTARAAADGEGEISFRWISERDRNMYDGLNKGIRMATGDIVGILNADDAFASDGVLAEVAAFWAANPGLDATYGDVRFVRRGDYADAAALRAAPTKRYLTGRLFRNWMFRFATFPAHPSTFVRRDCYLQYGLYSLEYDICADFEMMLRLFVKHGVRTKYLPLCTTVMRHGGLSTNGLKSKLAVNAQDLRALRANGVWSCWPLVCSKYLLKVWGYAAFGRRGGRSGDRLRARGTRPHLV